MRQAGTPTAHSNASALPKVVVAEHAGACFGVERALELVWRAVDEHPEGVCTLGPIIHNPTLVHDLEERGARVVKDVTDVRPGESLILRTHGVEPSVQERARELGLATIDATCPFVKKVHVAAERLAREGYQVIIVGEAGHPEVEGTYGHAPDALVIGSANEARTAHVERRVGLVVQTTLALATLQEVVDELLGRCEEVRVVNTICAATSERQQAAAELAARADVMLVIGGKISANTTHLAEICSRHCAATYHIERADELESSWFEGASLIGITAGASTPVSQINEVVSQLVS